MIGDLPLFAPAPELATPGPLHRTPDAPTSVAAAVSIMPKLNPLRRRVLELMAAVYPLGWTDDELRHLEEFQDYSHSTVGKRRTELTQAGLLEAVGTRDGFTVWALREGVTIPPRETP